MQRPIHQYYQPFLHEGGDPKYPYSEDPESLFYKFWAEEARRCIDGWKPGGGYQNITGRHYYYLNHAAIPISIGPYEYLIAPFYRDLEHEYADFIENEGLPKFDEHGNFIKGGSTIVIPKSRDKGFTMTNIVMNNIYEFTFFPNSHTLIATGNDSEMGKDKDVLKTCYFAQSAPFRHRLIQQNALMWQSGMRDEIKNDRGQIIDYKESGMLSYIHFRDNLNRKIDAANSLRVKFALIDEAGLINKLLKIHAKNEACYNRGSFQYAMVVIGGTSKSYEAKDMDYEDMYYKANELGFKTWFIPADKALSPYYNQQTGISDRAAAKQFILDKYERAKAVSFEQLQMVQQEYPLYVEHCFLKKTSQYLPHDIIDAQIERIVSHPDFDPSGLNDWPELEVGRLEWVRKVGDKVLNIGDMVEWIPDKKGKIKILKHPYHIEYGEHYKYAETAMVDSYNKEDSVISDSKGSVHVYRRFTELSRPGNMPVLEYFDRPSHTEWIWRGTEDEEMLVKKDIWYDNCHKIAVWRGVKLLVEDSDEEFFRFFRKRKALDYLEHTPKAVVSANSKIVKNYMINMSEDVKSKCTDLMDQNLTSYPENIFFLHLLREMKQWKQRNTDRCISFSGCLLMDSDLNARKRTAKKKDEKKEAPKPKKNFERRGGKLYLVDNKKEDSMEEWF